MKIMVDYSNDEYWIFDTTNQYGPISIDLESNLDAIILTYKDRKEYITTRNIRRLTVYNDTL